MELAALCVVCGACLAVQWIAGRVRQRSEGAKSPTRGNPIDTTHAAFVRLRRRYNIVYTLGTFGDWIQGAYLYALYREHGFSMADIGYLFVLGYFASASFGTYISSLGDVFGYRRFVILYGCVYGTACVLMRSGAVPLLVLSRVMSGVAYSLLFSSFESWAISEADRLRIDRRYLVRLFSSATFFNAVSAVAAGVVGNLAVTYMALPGSHPDDPHHVVTPVHSVGGPVVGAWGKSAWGGRDPGGGQGYYFGDFIHPGYGSEPVRGRYGGGGDALTGGARHVLAHAGTRVGKGSAGGIAGVVERSGTATEAEAAAAAATSAGHHAASTLLHPSNMYVPAFDIGAVVLALCALGAWSLWADPKPAATGVASAVTGGADQDAAEAGGAGVKHGEGPPPELERGIWQAARLVFSRRELLSLGVTNSLYEAALHVFVFVWTPALERRGPVVPVEGTEGAGDGGLASAVPHGLVFSLFMSCKMLGSQAFLLVGERVPANATLRVVFVGSLLCFIVPLLVKDYAVTLASFCLFEFGLGLYWPAMAVMRAELVPNHLRATMTSVFRVPLNVLVMSCLAFAGNASEPAFLAMCAGMMATCLYSIRTKRGASESK